MATTPEREADARPERVWAPSNPDDETDAPAHAERRRQARALAELLGRDVSGPE